jgi:hypothetical protein
LDGCGAACTDWERARDSNTRSVKRLIGCILSLRSDCPTGVLTGDSYIRVGASYGIEVNGLVIPYLAAFWW